MRIILVFLFVIGCNSYIKAQRYFADYMIIGTSLTYMRNSNKDSYKTDYGYDEFTWNTNIGIQISKRLFTGLQVLNIYSSQISFPKKYYVVYGLFSQYDFLKSNKNRLFAEISFNRGNYCIGDNIPYQVDDLHYVGFGAGYDYPIKKIPNLYLDLSFISYYILDKISDKYSYTQYIIGLNYRLGGK